MSLKDTLESMKREEEKRKNESSAEILRGWQTAVKDLYRDIEGFLHEYLSLGLQFKYYEKQVSEEELGSYSIEGMEIHTPNATIVLNPVARLIVGGFGRVDIHLKGRSFIKERAMLIRLAADDNLSQAKWIISSPPAPYDRDEALNFGPHPFMPLNKVTVEGAVDSLLHATH